MNRLKLDQKIFHTNSFKRLTPQNPHFHFQLCSKYLDQKPRPGRKFDVEAAIGTVALSDASDAGINVDVVLQRVDQLVLEGLINLAIESYPWPVDGDPEIAEQIEAQISGLPDTMRRRKIEELLDVYERPAKRFLVLDAEKVAKTTNDISPFVDSATGLPFWTLDAKKLANRVREFCSDPLFNLSRVS